MDTHKFFVEKLRFHLNEPDMLVFVGWFYDGKASGREVQAYLDGEKLPAALTVNLRRTAARRSRRSTTRRS